MGRTIEVQVTQQGMLIPRDALGDWDEVEVVRGNQVIVIRPKATAADMRSQVRHILREAGMLYEPDWETPPPVAQEERARLAKKLAQGQPLSEIIIADREDRA